MDSTLLRRSVVPAALALALSGAAVALAADREVALSAASPEATWDGGPVTGLLVSADSDETLIRVGDAGRLTASISDADDGAQDIDLFLYASDAEGSYGDEVASSANDGNAERIAVNVEPGYYLLEAYGWIATEGHYTGTAALKVAGGGTAPEPLPSPEPGPGAGGGADATPSAAITGLRRKVRARRLRRLEGTASDDRGVAKVEVAVVRRKGGGCRQMTATGAFAPLDRCDGPTRFHAAEGTTAWRHALPRRLKPGRYVAFARATDSADQVQAGFTAASKKRFRVRK